MNTIQPIDLENLENERCRAMISADMTALDRLFSDKLIWSHSSGHVDNKQEFLAKIEGGASQYLSISREDEKYVISAAAAIASGIVSQEVRLNGVERSLRSRYTARKSGVWGKRVSVGGNPGGRR